MKHLGDITKLSGYVVPAVDVVIGGSPCQGLSVAGKQAGLKDERSGLFIEQIRLVKEMRKADAARYATQASLDALHLLNVNACKVTRMGGPISVAGLIARAKSTRRAATQRGIKPSVTASQSHLGSGCSSGCARFTSEMPQWPVFLTASEAFRTFGSSSTAKEAAFGRAKLSRFLLR